MALSKAEKAAKAAAKAAAVEDAKRAAAADPAAAAQAHLEALIGTESVTLASGGPAMTVVNVTEAGVDSTVDVTWDDNGETKSATYAAAALIPTPAADDADDDAETDDDGAAPPSNPNAAPNNGAGDQNDAGADSTGEAAALREDGPTLEEFVAAGYKAENYPPSGYAARTEPAKAKGPPTLLELIVKALSTPGLSHGDANHLLGLQSRFGEMLNNLRMIELHTAPEIAEILKEVERAIGGDRR